MKSTIKHIAIFCTALFFLNQNAEAAPRRRFIRPIRVDQWVWFRIYNPYPMAQQGHAWHPLHAPIQGVDFRDFWVPAFTYYWVNLTPARGRIRTISYTRGAPLLAVFNENPTRDLRIDPPYEQEIVERFLRQAVGSAWDTPNHREPFLRLLHRIFPQMTFENANAIIRHWRELEYVFDATEALSLATQEHTQQQVERRMTELEILPQPTRRPVVATGVGGSGRRP